MDNVTELIRSLRSNDDASREKLFELVYEQLKSMAGRKMAAESPAHTLQPTALVNEVFLKLMNQTKTDWRDRRHFFGVASEAMRRILIDSARRKQRIKRGGKLERQNFSDSCAVVLPVTDAWIDLDCALTELEQVAPEKAELVKLRFFSGLTLQECADTLKISLSTAERTWRFCRAWLKTRISIPEELNEKS